MPEALPEHCPSIARSMVQASCELLALGFHVKPQRCFAALPHQTFIGTPAHTCPTDRCSSSAPSFLNVERCCRRLLVRPHPHRPDDGPLITPGRQLVRLCPGGCRHRPPRQTNLEGWLAVCCPSSRRMRCGLNLYFVGLCSDLWPFRPSSLIAPFLQCAWRAYATGPGP